MPAPRLYALYDRSGFSFAGEDGQEIQDYYLLGEEGEHIYEYQLVREVPINIDLQHDPEDDERV